MSAFKAWVLCLLACIATVQGHDVKGLPEAITEQVDEANPGQALNIRGRTNNADGGEKRSRWYQGLKRSGVKPARKERETRVKVELKGPEEKPNRGGIAPEDLCLKTAVLSLEEPKSTKGFLTQEDFMAELGELRMDAIQNVSVLVDGFPCRERGCCQHRMRIRPLTSDMFVLVTAINEYAGVLKRLLPWHPKTILEGGGNIGVATSMMAFMYPDAKIVALEPDPANCALLKENTQPFSNVIVECKGLWSKPNILLDVVQHVDSQPWGVMTVESNNSGKRNRKSKASSVLTTSVSDLLARHGILNFDFAKIDIENAEYKVFGPAEDLKWIEDVRLLAMEIHGRNSPQAEQLVDRVMSKGLVSFVNGEYDFFVSPLLSKDLEEEFGNGG